MKLQEETEVLEKERARAIAREIDKLILEEMREEHPEFFNKIILNAEL